MFSELAKCGRPDWREHPDLTVLQFLDLCLHPQGGLSRAERLNGVVIRRADDADRFVLRQPAGKTRDHLNRILRELLHSACLVPEEHGGTAVYMVLNRTLAGRKKPR